MLADSSVNLIWYRFVVQRKTSASCQLCYTPHPWVNYTLTKSQRETVCITCFSSPFLISETTSHYRRFALSEQGIAPLGLFGCRAYCVPEIPSKIFNPIYRLLVVTDIQVDSAEAGFFRINNGSNCLKCFAVPCTAFSKCSKVFQAVNNSGKPLETLF